MDTGRIDPVSVLNGQAGKISQVYHQVLCEATYYFILFIFIL